MGTRSPSSILGAPTKFLTGIIYLINNSLEFCKAKLRGPSSPPISEPQQLKKLYWRSGGNGFS
ncbi:hypothetical protein COY96_02390 [Candidatus Wolfebacteria bacterium CG_4_10_14_0_8_um_filter_37_11]|uniref:Uncharacterized protein n=1 Tax=Candidatus Wolfebacteria bacterium CG_4_10_14_0_8_um_filter_37_11 TaxID=1975062 RepID=A0A2M7Q7H7_9BACT|nr:MAG: hypothetical protein COY96_02390 [Candidatus Wolfebacteria bacterium CG_4_10_14_0_8_um_filter_37_11]